MNISTPYKTILYLAAIFSFNLVSFPQQKDTSSIIKDEIIVTAGMVPVSVSEVPRSVSIIRLEDIQNSPVQNLQDILSYVPGLDVKARGLEGCASRCKYKGRFF
jgi:vitamin B12 transporter